MVGGTEVETEAKVEVCNCAGLRAAFGGGGRSRFWVLGWRIRKEEEEDCECGACGWDAWG